jgi:hypothetical protein
MSDHFSRFFLLWVAGERQRRTLSIFWSLHNLMTTPILIFKFEPQSLEFQVNKLKIEPQSLKFESQSLKIEVLNLKFEVNNLKIEALSLKFEVKSFKIESL